MNLCIFEDDGANRLLPLTYLRPAFDLRCGTMTLGERIRKFFPGAHIFYQCREYLTDWVKEQNPEAAVNKEISESCLFVNGRVLMDEDLFKRVSADTNGAWMNGDTTVAFWNSLNTKKEVIDAVLIQFPWDLIRHNGAMISNDFSGSEISGLIYEGTHLVERKNIRIGKNSKVRPGAVLDAEHGPIIIGEEVTVMSNAVIEGPCFIGDHTIIKAGAKIYESTSIGETCKIGGEVEASIVHGLSNKQHDGFLGHSYISEWCNLGADTNTSDLKNNYSTVKVFANGVEVDTGMIFVGLMMGDHSKSGINTMFNTGTVVGVSCNVFGAGFPPKYIHSFGWADGTSIESYRLDKAVEVARLVMARRNVHMSMVYEKLLETVFHMTQPG